MSHLGNPVSELDRAILDAAGLNGQLAVLEQAATSGSLADKLRLAAAQHARAQASGAPPAQLPTPPARSPLDDIAAGLESNRAARAQRQAQLDAAAAAVAADPRAAFATAHLSDLPTVYRDQLGTDPSRWPGEAARLRLQHRFDFGRPLSANELIQLGLSQQPAARAAG